MTLWLKVLLWLAVLVLPGGLLLSPLLVAVHRRERAGRSGADRDRSVTPGVTV